MAASEAVPRQVEEQSPSSAAASVHRRSWMSLTVALAALTAGSIWFGYLDDADGEKTVKLGLALVLTVLGLGTVLLVRLFGDRDSGLFVDVARTTLGLLSMSAALIHLAVVEQHLSEYWLYGWFFIVAGAAQAAWAPLVIVRPARSILIAGGLANAAIAITWVVTRTYGAILGPDATEPARAGFGDIVSTVIEMVIVLGIVLLVVRTGDGARGRTRTGDLLSGFVALLVVPLTVLALYSAVGGQPFVSHVG